MSIEYLIRKAATCPSCGGDGRVSNADWEKIDQANNEWMASNGIETFNEAAMADWERRIAEQWPYGDPPPEEEPCCECNGEGKIETWVPLVEALIEIGAISPQQLPDWAERGDELVDDSF